jgi:predicted Zn-dependent peptidase
MPLTDRLLENGIRLITEPIAATKAVAIGFWFSCGSRDETQGLFGVTHFIEHMLFKGTDRYSAFAIARFFDSIGGYLNAFTEREYLCFYCVVPFNKVTESFDIMLDMVFRSVIRDDDVEKERSVIVSEVLSSLDDAEETGTDVAVATLYAGHGLSRPIAGSVEDVESLSADAIRAQYRNLLDSVPLLVTVAGNVDPELIARQLGEVSYKATLSLAVKSVPPTWNPGRFFVESRFSQSQVFLSFPLRSVSSPDDWFSWAIINAIIGDSVSSRLFQNLREKRGLCYSLYSFYSCNRDSALWSAYLAVPPERTREAVESLLAELESVRSNGVSDTEVIDAQGHISGELLLSAEDTENRMKRLARQFFYGGKMLSIEESIDCVMMLSREDIASRITSAFGSQDESLIVYAGKKSLKECKKIWR